MTDLKERRAAKKRLKPATIPVLAECVNRNNDANCSYIVSVYENAVAFAEVKANPDDHGMKGLDDLALAMDIEERRRNRWLQIAKNISRPEFELFTSQLSAEGDNFTATHLYQLARLPTAADRKAAWGRWKKDAMDTRSFGEYVNSLLAADKDDAEEASSTAQKSPVQKLSSSTKLLDKACDKLEELDDIDFPTLTGTTDHKVLDRVGSFKIACNSTIEMLKQLVDRISNVPDREDGDLESDEESEDQVVVSKSKPKPPISELSLEEQFMNPDLIPDEDEEEDESEPKADVEKSPVKKRRRRRTKAEMEAAAAAESKADKSSTKPKPALKTPKSKPVSELDQPVKKRRRRRTKAEMEAAAAAEPAAVSGSPAKRGRKPKPKPATEYEDFEPPAKVGTADEAVAASAKGPRRNRRRGK